MHAATACPVWFATLVLLSEDTTDEDFTLKLHMVRIAPRKPPVSINDKLSSLQGEVMQAYADVVSTAIRNHPHQYFWWHRRWRRGDEEEAVSSSCNEHTIDEDDADAA